MAALSLDTVRTFALVATAVFVVAAIASAVLLRSIAQKAAVAVIFVLLAALVWSQRTAVEECIHVIRASVTTESDASCSFFGRDVSFSNSRSDG